MSVNRDEAVLRDMLIEWGIAEPDHVMPILRYLRNRPANELRFYGQIFTPHRTTVSVAGEAQSVTFAPLVESLR